MTGWDNALGWSLIATLFVFAMTVIDLVNIGESCMVSSSIELIADDLFFPEGPRWRAGEQKLYFSDVMA